MKIQSLEIRNIRGIKSFKIEPKGQNVVVFGPNGAGKSAIVDAIDFLLTGRISRLTGEGTKDLSLAQHGCHIDTRDNLKNATVAAKVSIGDKEIVLERGVSKPTKLKIAPKKCSELINPYLETAELGLHILSRREILKYITAEAGKRAKEVMSLLNLTNVENARSAFVTARNEAKENLKHAESDLVVERSELGNLLSLDSLSEKTILDRVNELRRVLNGTEIKELHPENVKEKLESQPFGLVAGALTKEHIENIIKETRTLIQKKDEIVKSELELRTLLGEAHQEVKFGQFLLYAKLFEIATALIDESNTCPLCDRKWDGDFREYLEEKKKETETSKIKQARIDDLSTFIKTQIEMLKSDVEKCFTAHKQFALKVVEDKESADYLSTLDVWSQVMVRPLNFFEDNKWPTTGLQNIFDPPFLEAKILGALEDTLKRTGETFSKQQTAWDTLTKTEDYLKRYLEAIKNREVADIYARRAEASLDYFEKSRDSVLEGIYDDVKDNFEKYYKTIHSDDEGKFASKLMQQKAELSFLVDFHQRGMFPPHALHSEGHQDSMGLCLFFALNNYLVKDTLKVVVLDDVIMSIDCNHRRSICQLLKVFTDRQYIITTHDNAWAKQLRTEGVVVQRNMIHFTNWNIDTGPIFELERDLWDRIKEDLDKDDVPAAAHRLRRNAECYFENVCDFLSATVSYKGDHRWELGDFAPAAVSAYRVYLKKAKASFEKMGQKEKSKQLEEVEKKSAEIIIKSQVEQWIINENVHFSKWSEFSKKDFEPVVAAFKELFALFTCGSCGSIIQISKSASTQKEVISCGCGEVFWPIQ